MAVSQVGSTTTSYYVTNGANSASTSSMTSTSSTTATSSATAVSSTTLKVGSASTTSSATAISSATLYASATAKTTCSTTVTYSGSSSTAKVSSTTVATVEATSTNKTGASASTTASTTATVTSSATLQNKINDSILRIKAELDKETGIYIPPYYPTNASSTALNYAMAGLMVDIGKGSSEEDSIKYAKVVLQEMNFYEKDEMEIAAGKLSGEYNDSLEQSVRRFQTMFQLPITGKIDEETWKEIHKQLYDGYAIKRENNKQVLTEALSSMRYENGIELVKERYYSEESINNLLDTIAEFGIDDDTELQVFLSQALHECLRDSDGIENGNGSKYAGAGALQLTHELNYKSFAVYEMLRENPEMQGCEYIIDDEVKELDFVFYAKNGKKDVENNYDGAIMVAKDLGIDIKKYTDIVDVGKTYVAENYFWKSAGFFWMSEGIGKKIEGLTLDEGMVISTEDINSEEEENYPKRYKNRLDIAKYIKSVSDILEGIQW